MTEIDEITIRQAAKKDQRAFRRIYDHYSSFVWKVIYRTVNGNTDAAKEIVQETFIRVYSSLSSFAFNSALSTWIYRIAFNTANTYMAKNSRKKIFISQEMDLLTETTFRKSYEDKEIVGILLNTVSPEERFLLMSREVEGITFEELSEITGKSPESLRTSVSRLKDKLRTAYRKITKAE
jgi:RNA polymerase sigma-70 factor, ECF subfamily